MKKCSKCKIEKDESCFNKRKNGLRSECRDCQKKQGSGYRDRNRDKILVKQRKYYKDNREVLLEKSKNYNNINKDKIKKYHQSYYIENKEMIDKRNKEYNEKNKDEIKNNRHEYYIANKPAILKQNREYRIKKIKNDPRFRLRCYVSNLINSGLKARRHNKNGKSIINYLPFNFNELKKHLESLFSHSDNLTPDGKVWMNWNNQGQYKVNEWDENDPSTWKWHLDHKKAHTNFKYASMEDQEFKDCWALSNLRPLSAKQNVIDGSRKKE